MIRVFALSLSVFYILEVGYTPWCMVAMVIPCALRALGMINYVYSYLHLSV